jgi:hypothetical protein
MLQTFVSLTPCHCGLSSISNPVYIQQLTEVILAPIHNSIGIWEHITILIHYKVSCRMVLLLKFIYASIQISNILVCTVYLKLTNSMFLFLKCLLVAYFTLIRLSPLIGFRSCIHISLACFLDLILVWNIHHQTTFSAT